MRDHTLRIGHKHPDFVARKLRADLVEMPAFLLSPTAKPAKLPASISYGASHARADHIAGRRRASHDRRPIEITRYLAVNSCCRSVKIALAVAGHVKNPIDDCARGDRERTRNVIEVDA